jgi:hypothetical protein
MQGRTPRARAGEEQARRLEHARQQREAAWAAAAAAGWVPQPAAGLHGYASTVAEAMERHGLSAAERELLRAEGAPGVSIYAVVHFD